MYPKKVQSIFLTSCHFYRAQNKRSLFIKGRGGVNFGMSNFGLKNLWPKNMAMNPNVALKKIPLTRWEWGGKGASGGGGGKNVAIQKGSVEGCTPLVGITAACDT